MIFPLRNREGKTPFNIHDDWYKYRHEGISAFIRTKGDERWIGPCIESILDFFDEIVVTVEPTKDRTIAILKRFKSPKIAIYRYPFKLDPAAPMDSVRSGAYYTNWTVAMTTCSHIFHWDADMIMLPSFKENRERILESNIVRIVGYDVVTPDFKYISKSDRSDSQNLAKLADIRGYRANKHLFTIWNKKLYLRGLRNPGKYSFNAIMDRFNYHGNTIDILDPRLWVKYPFVQMQHISNIATKKDIAILKPAYLHVKYLKDWKGKYVTEANEATTDPSSQKGKETPVEIPSFVFKTPEDYLNGTTTHKYRKP